MLISILIISIAFGILLHETNYFRIRLPYGEKRLDNGIKLLTAGKVETILMLPVAKRSSYFMPCELENPDVISKNIVKIGAKIL